MICRGALHAVLYITAQEGPGRAGCARRCLRCLGLVGRGTWGSKVCETSSVGLRAAVWHYAPSWQVGRPGRCSSVRSRRPQQAPRLRSQPELRAGATFNMLRCARAPRLPPLARRPRPRRVPRSPCPRCPAVRSWTVVFVAASFGAEGSAAAFEQLVERHRSDPPRMGASAGPAATNRRQRTRRPVRRGTRAESMPLGTET